MSLDAYCCPGCGALLSEISEKNGVTCMECGVQYPRLDGILSFLVPATRALYDTADIESVADDGSLDEEQVLRANFAYHEAFASDYEGDFSTKEIFTEDTRSRIRDVVELAKMITRGECWLDVGCGTGNVLSEVHKEFPCAKGLDLSLGMLKVAAAKNLDVAQGEAYRLPFPDNSADVISAFAMLHHLHDTGLFFQEAFRVLRPGGLLYTDHDPNNVRDPRNSFIWRLLRSGYNFVQRRGTRRIEQNPNALKTLKVADYQAYHGEGFNGESQIRRLRGMGFASANVIYHVNSPSIYDPSRAPAMTHVLALLRSPLKDWFNMRVTAPHFLLLATKPTE